MSTTWCESVKDPRYRAVVKAYRGDGVLSGLYAAIRMALCPLGDIEGALPQAGKVVDVGCGAGLLLQWVALGKKSRDYQFTGLEIDPRRVALGKRVCLALGISDRVDLRVRAFGEDDDGGNVRAVVFVDVLHHMTYDLQKTMLLQGFRLLGPGGVLIIKDVGTSPLLKYLYNYLFDAMTGLMRITRGKVGYYRSRAEWAALLTECGFQASVAEVRHTDFAPHIMVTGTKPGHEGATP